MHTELWYQIALTLIPDIGPVLRKRLINYFETAHAVFAARKKELSAIEGIGEKAARQIKSWDNFSLADDEMKFIEKHGITPLFINHKQYPQRLLNCYDAPTMLYWKGIGNLNAPRMLNIIGTRMNTAYGKLVTENIIRSLPDDVVIVSGLALGIDAIAHRNALTSGHHTIGVLAHGLDDLYPAQNKPLAKEMLHHGGLLTEFNQKTKPDKHNFPRRNRVVAGITDATLVIETAVKGGSMITADLAFQYNREVFAVPGKITDLKSSGCLQLIQQNKAIVFTSTEQLMETMGWLPATKKTVKKQLEIFTSLTNEEQMVVKILEEKDVFAMEELISRTNLNSSAMAAALLSLEMQNIINIIPGKMIALS